MNILWWWKCSHNYVYNKKKVLITQEIQEHTHTDMHTHAYKHRYIKRVCFLRLWLTVFSLVKRSLSYRCGGKKRDLANNCSSWHKQDSCWKMLILQIVHSITGEVTALLYDDNSREGKKRSFPEGTSRCRENNLHAEFPLWNSGSVNHLTFYKSFNYHSSIPLFKTILLQQSGVQG